MKNKRVWILVFLFFLSSINYVDRVALSVSAKPIAAEFGLSPVQLGYMFSSFLWLYVLCLIPMGMIVDRVGTRAVNAAGIGLWSLATVFTGLAGGFGTLIATRLAMGVGESTSYPAGNRVIREWMPASERGLAMSIFNSGAYFGPAIGSIVIGALVAAAGWRIAFFVCGAIGFVWLAAWLMRYRVPELTPWLDPEERALILRERNAGSDLPAGTPALGIAGLIGAPTLWGIMLTQGCGVYTQYLFLTWLPGYLQTQKGIGLLASATLMAVPYLGAVVLGILLGRVSDRLLTGHVVTTGRRRLMVAAMMLLGSVILLVPTTNSVPTILLLITVALTGVSSAISLNFALLNDVLKSPADIGTATGMQVFGGNVFGLLAPIITGYVIAATGNFDLAFVIAGCLLVIGVVSSLVLTRGTIDARV
ncbi:MFS transporter [Siculibacillus lacustris]|uniref:MFS transporter n=1 Tax=Siculibacillus lacustris TaxID=1549641 RepID=A0A4Q9VTY5_9HYPH|nr:MFS transporter [Siculibacillus lacustris]TBW39452.1 MFS transporter [Siculibacillus lacustris]